MLRHAFSVGDRSGLQAGQSSTRTLCLRSHAVVTRAEWGLALSCWNRHGVPGKSCYLDGSICLSKIPTEASELIVPSHICRSGAFSSNFCPWPLCTEISPVSLNLFGILWTVDGERPTFFAILHWETCLWTDWQFSHEDWHQVAILACRPVPPFLPHHRWQPSRPLTSHKKLWTPLLSRLLAKVTCKRIPAIITKIP